MAAVIRTIVMNWFLIATVVVLGCATRPSPLVDAQAQPSSELEYEISSATVRGVSEIKFVLHFNGSASGQTTLILPTPLYNSEKVFAGMRDLRAVSAETFIEDTDTSTKKRVRYPFGAKVGIEYRIQQISDPSTEPMVRPTYFYFNGTLFAHPDLGDTPAHIKINWQLPGGWTLANSFESENKHQDFTAVFNDNPVGNMRYSAFVAGDFRVQKLMIKNHPVVFATRGKWKITDGDFVDIVRKVITSQREMWRDFDVPYYFVLLLPNGKPCCSRGGHGLTHSFVIDLSEQEYNSAKFTSVLSHEHFHYWNGEKLAPKQGSEFWFTEGFTDYYSKVLNYRADILSYQNFVDDFNSAIYRYYESPVREANDERVEKEFMEDSEIAQLPYSKGDVVASEWNFTIKEKSQNRKSLDDLMHAVYAKSKTNPQGLTKAIVRTSLEELVGPETASALMDMALSGAMVKPSNRALGPCAHLEMVEMGRLEYGYDRYAPTPTVNKVKLGSAAYRAGLRDGQRILEKREEWFKPWKPVELKIDENGKTRWLRFLPQSEESISFPRYKLERPIDSRCREL